MGVGGSWAVHLYGPPERPNLPMWRRLT